MKWHSSCPFLCLGSSCASIMYRSLGPVVSSSTPFHWSRSSHRKDNSPVGESLSYFTLLPNGSEGPLNPHPSCTFTILLYWEMPVPSIGNCIRSLWDRQIDWYGESIPVTVNMENLPLHQPSPNDMVVSLRARSNCPGLRQEDVVKLCLQEPINMAQLKNIFLFH